MRRASLIVLAIGWALRLPAEEAWAQGCAMCGNSFAPDDPAAVAMNTSIVFLLLMPYVLLAAVGGWLYLRYRGAGSPRRAAVIPLPWVRAGSPGAHEKE